ncbi:MAG: restriction endonuclease subunit S [Gemmatimonadaceae bacterium]
MKLSPYQRYTPSGIEWLGDVPAHWEVKRGRFCMDVNPSSNRLRTLRSHDEVSFVPMEAVGEYGGLDLDQTRTISEVTSGYTEFDNGDVVVAKITPCFENGKGALAEGLVNGVAFGTTELHVLRATPTLDRRLLFYFTMSGLFRSTGEGEMYGAGGQKRVPATFCENIRVPLPPLGEQRAIVAFLDCETAKIDALVTKKRALIDRLKEKHIALISRTVTRGLPPDAARAAGFDPHPKLKPSGIDWLGDVPAHWDVKRLKFVVNAPLKYGANEAAEVDDPDLPRYVRITDIDQKDRLREDTFKSLPADVTAEYLLREGDLLFARSGATAGKTFLYRRIWGECVYAGYLIRARLDTRKAVPAFVRYFTASSNYWQWLASAFIQATIQNVSAERYASLWLPLAPLHEQKPIVAFLDCETAKIDEMVTKVETAIERLQEYRTAVITAAVTGRIDVRGASPHAYTVR